MGLLYAFFATAFVLSSQCMRVLRMSRTQAAASQVIQQRNEQVRVETWPHISGTTLASNILGQDADGANMLMNPVETVVVAPFSTGAGSIVATGTNTFVRASGTTTITTSGTTNDLSSNTAVQVSFQVTWTEPSTLRTLSRTAITIVANGGVPK